MELKAKRLLDELREFGDVACALRNGYIPDNGEDRAGATHVISCVVSAPGSTVEIRAVTSDLANDLRKVADLVETVS